MEVVVAVQNIMLHMACKLLLLGTFLRLYTKLKDCIVETKVPSFRFFFFPTELFTVATITSTVLTH